MMKNPHPSRRRVYVLLGFFCAFLVLFFAVLYDAQVVHGSENRARSITSNTASETVTASRGIITDRNGKVLVSNRLAYTLVVDKSSFGKDEAALNDAIWQLIQLCQEQGVTWNDTLPMTRVLSPADQQKPDRELPGVSGRQQAAHGWRQRGSAGRHAEALQGR